jgi:hypothetical protein
MRRIVEKSSTTRNLKSLLMNSSGSWLCRTRTLDDTVDLDCLLTLGQPERASEHRYIFGKHGQLAREVGSQHIAGAQIEQLGKGDGAATEQPAELDNRIAYLVLQRSRPTIVMIDPIALHS